MHDHEPRKAVRLGEYLSLHQAEFWGIFFLLVLFFVMFLIYALPLDAFWMASSFVLFLSVLWHGIRWSFERQAVDWERIAKERQETLRRVQAIQAKQNEDLEEYFLTWVHQLKTPITGAKLIADQTDPIEEEDRKALSTQLIAIEGYTDMAMSYIKVANPSSDLDLAQTDIDPVIRALLRKYARLFIDGHLRVDYQPMGEYVASDARWFGILFEQLLSNSLKYTKEGEIRIFSPEKRVLEIQDTGVGIRPEDLPRIFERGYSGWNGRTNERASGIGLYLVKRIAEKLSIHIELKSTWGEGTTVRLRFPEPFTLRGEVFES